MTPENRAEEFTALHMPIEWFDDAHSHGSDPRCCAFRDKLAAAFRAAIAEALEETDLTCEAHVGYRLVWCNECVKIDRVAWQKRVAEEREACAGLADSIGGADGVTTAKAIAAAIRARGDQS